jgi:hypothetical protein
LLLSMVVTAMAVTSFLRHRRGQQKTRLVGGRFSSDVGDDLSAFAEGVMEHVCITR